MRQYKRLQESDLNRLAKKVIKEQHGYGPWMNDGPGPGAIKTYTNIRPVKMDGSLFKNGVDKIDTNSSEFQKGVTALKNAGLGGRKFTVTVQGGASAVGSKSGYDNKSLAKRRAKNFIDSVKSLFPNAKFEEGDHVVGIATKKDSPEANAEQFVKLGFDVEDVTTYRAPAIDNTAMRLKMIPPKTSKGENFVTVCVKMPEKILAEFQDFIKSKNIKTV